MRYIQTNPMISHCELNFMGKTIFQDILGRFLQDRPIETP